MSSSPNETVAVEAFPTTARWRRSRVALVTLAALSLPVAMLEGADARQLFDVLERELFDAANDATL